IRTCMATEAPTLFGCPSVKTFRRTAVGEEFRRDKRGPLDVALAPERNDERKQGFEIGAVGFGIARFETPECLGVLDRVREEDRPRRRFERGERRKLAIRVESQRPIELTSNREGRVDVSCARRLEQARVGNASFSGSHTRNGWRSGDRTVGSTEFADEASRED